MKQKIIFFMHWMVCVIRMASNSYTPSSSCQREGRVNDGDGLLRIKKNLIFSKCWLVVYACIYNIKTDTHRNSFSLSLALFFFSAMGWLLHTRKWKHGTHKKMMKYSKCYSWKLYHSCIVYLPAFIFCVCSSEFFLLTSCFYAWQRVFLWLMRWMWMDGGKLKMIRGILANIEGEIEFFLN